jgi:osmotically-inducible protein OsmY
MSNSGLATTVQDALMQHAPLRVWKHALKIEANDGRIVLTGVVRSHSAKAMAERIARGVNGVQAIENRLVVDDDVEVAIAQDLAADPCTRAGFPGILVGVVFGVAYLKGTVSSAAIKDAATLIVSKLAGVQRISNELTVSSPIPAA